MPEVVEPDTFDRRDHLPSSNVVLAAEARAQAEAAEAQALAAEARARVIWPRLEAGAKSKHAPKGD